MLRNQQNNVMKQAALDGKESECSSVLVDCGSFVANIEQIVDTTPQTVLGTRIVTLGDKPKSRKSSRQGQSPLEVSSSTSATNLQEMYRLSESLHSIRDKERALEAIACCSNAAEAALKTSPPGERSSLEVQVLRFATNPATDRLVKLRVLDALRSVKPQLDFELACIRESAGEHVVTVMNGTASIRDRIHAFRAASSQISFLLRNASSDEDRHCFSRWSANICKPIHSDATSFRLLLMLHSQLPQ